MKSLFMFANYSPDDLGLGITKKIRAQIMALRSYGYTVTYTAYTEFGVCIYDDNDQVIYEKDFPIRIRELYRYARMFWLTNVAEKYLRDRKFDIAFVRWSGLGADMIRLLKTIRKNCSHTVMDAHAYFTGKKGDTLISKYIADTTARNEKKVHGLIDVVMTETDEKQFFGATTIKYDNGIDIGLITPHYYTGNNNELNIISVANERAYHGYDRIIKSIAAYGDRSIKVKLHLVGLMSDMTKELIKELRLTDRVFLHGKQYGTALDEIYNLCNIAAGPVGQHRVGGKQGTGLKTKEFFAKGIPYFYGGNELFVPDDYPYVLKIPSDESLIDFDKIYTFYKGIYGKDIVNDMRRFTEEHFTWNIVFDKVFSKLGIRTEVKK